MIKRGPAQNMHQEYLSLAVGEVGNHLAGQVEDAVNVVDRPIPELRKKQEQLLEQHENEPALLKLTKRLELSNFERDLVVLCAGVELNDSLAELVHYLTQDTGGFPTLNVAWTLLEPEPDYTVLGSNRPLRKWELVQVVEQRALTQSPLRLEKGILHVLLGEHQLNESLESVSEPVSVPERAGKKQRKRAEEIAGELQSSSKNHQYPPVVITGRQRTSREHLAALIGSELEVQIYRVDEHVLPAEPDEIRQFARLWEREFLLHRHTPIVIGREEESDHETSLALLTSMMDTPIFISRRVDDGLERMDLHSVETVSPAPEEQRSLWKDLLHLNAEQGNGRITELVSQFDLDVPEIRATAGHVRRKAELQEEDDAPIEDLLWSECVDRQRPGLDTLATRIDPKPTWDDLVLPDNQKEILQTITAQVRQRIRVYRDWGFADKSSRGLGISTLFSGPSGTGKTMASEVIANDLALDLYRIDLSSVVSKYIGETEKNLRRIFDAAEGTGTILLFDEADALFGKRSNVQSSNDRYANIEVSYLLQRMEAYRGLAILTTNLRDAIDDAFQRRIRFIVEFQFPDAEQRKKIWKSVFPEDTPTGEIDYDLLAELSITGGNIRNIAMNAAFRAADQDEHVDMQHIRHAVEVEYEKLDKHMSSSAMSQWDQQGEKPRS